MALEASDIEKLAALIESKVTAAVNAAKADLEGAVQGTAAVAESAPVQEAVQAAREFYVHLADGNVVTLPEDQANTSHVNGVAIIGKYLVGG